MAIVSTVAKAYATRGLIVWSAVSLAALVALTVGAARVWPDQRLTAFAFFAVGVQVWLTATCGFVAATALELMWGEQARVAPGVRRGHGVVVASILTVLVGGCLAAGAFAGFGQWAGGFAGLWGVVMVAAGVGVWIISSGGFWWVPTLVFFIMFVQMKAAEEQTVLPAVSGWVQGLAGTVAVAGWFARVMWARPGKVPWEARILEAFTDWMERLWLAGPLRGIAPRIWERAEWRRMARVVYERARSSPGEEPIPLTGGGDRVWRVTRWWPGATSGNEWPWLAMVLMTGVPMQIIAWSGQDDMVRRMLAGLATMGVMYGGVLTGERSKWIEMESVWPVRRAALLREVGCLILAEVTGLMAVAALMSTVLLARSDWAGMGPAGTLGWTAWMIATALSALAATWWVHRYPAGFLGFATPVGWLVASWLAGAGAWHAAGAPGIWCTTALLSLAAVIILRDAYRRWLVTDLSDPEGARRISAQLEVAR